VAEASRRTLDVLGRILTPTSRRAVAGAAPETACRGNHYHRRGSPLAAGGATGGATEPPTAPLERLSPLSDDAEPSA